MKIEYKYKSYQVHKVLEFGEVHKGLGFKIYDLKFVAECDLKLDQEIREFFNSLLSVLKLDQEEYGNPKLEEEMEYCYETKDVEFKLVKSQESTHHLAVYESMDIEEQFSEDEIEEFISQHIPWYETDDRLEYHQYLKFKKMEEEDNY